MLLCLYLPSSNRMLVRLVFLLSFLQLGCCIYSVFCLSFCLFLANKRVHNFIHSRNIEGHLKFMAWQVTRMIGLPYAEESMIIC